MGKIIDPFPADDRDGDLASSSRTELEGTHGQRGRGSYCPNQLICVFSDLPTGLTYFNKDVVFFFFFPSCSFIILDQVQCISHCILLWEIYMLEYNP